MQASQSWKLHLSGEPQCSSFKCGLCKLVCETSAKLDKHMKNHDEDGDWTCGVCPYQTNNQNNLLNYLLEKHNHSATLLDYLLTKNVFERKEKCTICGDLFESKDNLHTIIKIIRPTSHATGRIPALETLAVLIMVKLRKEFLCVNNVEKNLNQGRIS